MPPVKERFLDPTASARWRGQRVSASASIPPRELVELRERVILVHLYLFGLSSQHLPTELRGLHAAAAGHSAHHARQFGLVRWLGPRVGRISGRLDRGDEVGVG